MADDLSLYWSLFHGQFPDEWKCDAEFTQYLSQLSAYSVEKLQLEPERLAEERKCVLNSTQKLAFNNYQTFIETADCTRVVFKDFVSVEEHVERLLQQIPGFLSACHQFAEAAQEVNSSRQQSSLALSQHARLLEVLEIPQVVEACVRNGYYEEALDLCTHVYQMEKKHGSIPIVKAIWSDVETSMSLMLQQLLQQLRGPIQLPACLRVVGFLRRMETFSGAELRLRFLQARDCWLRGVLHSIPKDDPYHHLSKSIEVSRVHLFDIVTQYRAIFPDDDTLYHSSSSQPHLDGALFYTWLGSKVWEFLQMLEDDLSRGVTGRMDSLLSQCMYFGLSFSRIGADFRPLITPVFVRAAVSHFRLSLRNAKHSFHEAMKKLVLVSPVHGTTLTFPSITSSLAPPSCLLDYAPLASLTNSLLAALNDLRQCVPLAVGPDLVQEMRRLLESIVHDIGEFYKTECNSFSEVEKASFEQLVRVMVQHFLPFVRKCFSALFSKPAVAELSLSTTLPSRQPAAPPTTSSTLSLELDEAAIAEPLRLLCPAVFTEIEQVAAEAMVVGSERDSDSGEGDHVTGEGDHVTGKGDHVTGEGDHMTGKGDHVTGEGGHVTGKGDHVTGKGGHVTGEGAGYLVTSKHSQTRDTSIQPTETTSSVPHPTPHSPTPPSHPTPHSPTPPSHPIPHSPTPPSHPTPHSPPSPPP